MRSYTALDPDAPALRTRCPSCGAEPGEQCSVKGSALAKAIELGRSPHRLPHPDRRVRATRRAALTVVR